jgi:GTPase SAR1 family protein
MIYAKLRLSETRSFIFLRYCIPCTYEALYVADLNFKIVVIGDTSTGKSSVLQALTRLPFPVAGDLCTRFVTETTIRRCGPFERPGYNIEVKMGGSNTSQAAPFAPKSFESDEWVEVYRKLKEDIDEAFDEMSPTNLLPSGSSKKAVQTKYGASSASDRPPQLLKHRLQITVRKPNQAHFSIVDIPGLVSSKSVSEFNSSRKFILVCDVVAHLQRAYLM